MKTLSLSELHRDPVASLKAVRKGHGVRVMRRAQVIAEIEPVAGTKTNPAFDANYLKRHRPAMPRAIKRGGKGAASVLAADCERR